jgi:hypothetical protein
MNEGRYGMSKDFESKIQRNISGNNKPPARPNVLITLSFAFALGGIALRILCQIMLYGLRKKYEGAGLFAMGAAMADARSLNTVGAIALSISILGLIFSIIGLSSHAKKPEDIPKLIVSCIISIVAMFSSLGFILK